MLRQFFRISVYALRERKTGNDESRGGMGTRIGSDNPKGMYDIGETKPVYIFQRIIENLLDVVHETDTWIRLFIMTSEKNHDATVKFLKEKNYFGYKEDRVVFFKQDMAPACDYNGKLYMEAKDRISTSPNGNAGWYSSMVRTGLDNNSRRSRIRPALIPWSLHTSFARRMGLSCKVILKIASYPVVFNKFFQPGKAQGKSFPAFFSVKI